MNGSFFIKDEKPHRSPFNLVALHQQDAQRESSHATQKSAVSQ